MQELPRYVSVNMVSRLCSYFNNAIALRPMLFRDGKEPACKT